MFERSKPTNKRKSLIDFIPTELKEKNLIIIGHYFLRRACELSRTVFKIGARGNLNRPYSEHNNNFCTAHHADNKMEHLSSGAIRNATFHAY